MTNNKYQCSVCNVVFNKGWSDDEAREERSKLYGNHWIDEDCEIVCDDCFQNIKPIDYEEFRAKIRKDMADNYRRIKNHTLRRLLWKHHNDAQKEFENLIMYGVSHVN